MVYLILELPINVTHVDSASYIVGEKRKTQA